MDNSTTTLSTPIPGKYTESTFCFTVRPKEERSLFFQIVPQRTTCFLSFATGNTSVLVIERNCQDMTCAKISRYDIGGTRYIAQVFCKQKWRGSLSSLLTQEFLSCGTYPWNLRSHVSLSSEWTEAISQKGLLSETFQSRRIFMSIVMGPGHFLMATFLQLVFTSNQRQIKKLPPSASPLPALLEELILGGHRQKAQLHNRDGCSEVHLGESNGLPSVGKKPTLFGAVRD